ncbi:MAG TPA: TrkA C-terminal domain-containing protein [Vicinamibacteria bacterium]|jgi:TrkA domain protein
MHEIPLLINIGVALARTGASVVALYRDGSLVPSPTPDFKLAPGDRLGLIGDPGHVEAAERLVAGTAAIRANA